MLLVRACEGRSGKPRWGGRKSSRVAAKSSCRAKEVILSRRSGGGDSVELITRVARWSEIRKVRPMAEAADVAAGRDGELALRDLVGASYRLGDASVFAGRRIPSRRQGRRREIDLIVCTPRVIHLIEAK